MTKKLAWAILGFGLSALVAVSVLAIYISAVRKDLHQAALDVSDSAAWQLSGGTLGQVNVTIIEECANVSEHVAKWKRFGDPSLIHIYSMMCPNALRGALRFYSGLGGAYGCTQVRRALLVYGSPADEISLRAAASCEKYRGGLLGNYRGEN